MGTVPDQIRGLFVSLQEELQDAQYRVRQLQQELESQRVYKPSCGLAALRRYVVFHCHPDRGGDTQMMQELNGFFDFHGGVRS